MKKLLVLSLITFLTTGCVSTSKQKQSGDDVIAEKSVKTEYAANNIETHEVSGKTYYVKESETFKQRGQASWYGHAFHGRRTASGERFNMHEMTAAHSSLPLPSYVRVTNLNNGKKVILRVNDRMPRHKSRVIDVSYAAAHKLGMHRAGLAPVTIERVYLVED